MLEVSNLEVAYGSITALHSITVRVEKGKIVTLIGSNGAGKSTTLRAVSGLLKVRSGRIELEGKDITNLAPHLIVGLGITQVPEGRL
jgi:branched-chain amino acid transport system ATP-binding protein